MGLTKILIFFFILTFLSCGKNYNSFEQLSSLNNRTYYSNSVPLKWNKKDFPLKLFISEEFLPKNRDENNYTLMDRVLEKWDSGINENIFRLPMPTRVNRNYENLIEFKDEEMGIYKSYEWFDELQTGTIAVTQYFGIRKNKGTPSEYLELFHADIIFNYRDYNFSSDPNDLFLYDLPSVLLHEAGHLLGLLHESNTKTLSVMRPYLSPKDVQRNLFSEDKVKLEKKYSSQKQSSSFSALKTNTATAQSVIERGIIELNAKGECWLTRGNKKVLLHHH